MKTKNVVLVMLSITLAGIIISCSDNNPNDPTKTESKTVSVTNINATSYGDVWIYYSLEQGKVVQVEESTRKTDMSWDIAFNRYNVRTNSGLSGAGFGGVFDCGKVDFASIKEIPANSVFEVDTDWEIVKNISTMPPEYMTSTANPLLSVAISSAGMPPSYSSNEHIYIVRTAGGKYAKLIMIGYYNDAIPPKSGFISFDYVIQKDGDLKF